MLNLYLINIGYNVILAQGGKKTVPRTASMDITRIPKRFSYYKKNSGTLA